MLPKRLRIRADRLKQRSTLPIEAEGSNPNEPHSYTGFIADSIAKHIFCPVHQTDEVQDDLHGSIVNKQEINSYVRHTAEPVPAAYFAPQA